VQPLDPLFIALNETLLSDRRPLRRQLHALARRNRAAGPVDETLAALIPRIEASAAAVAARRAALVPISYPETLPVSGKRAEIAAAIAAHQVVIVAGETGSGKTTQLPKICLELGRGIYGTIGHTQPRRIAARSVASRIAEELQRPLGSLVGYKIRFSDRTLPTTLVKVMTDGILLAEAQQDRLLDQYDTIIIDEAHERSLNIDFLLGYLKQLLPRRNDLKLIITSATLNTEAFSNFFDGAPIIEVSGRTWPVEVRYRPPLGEDEESRELDLPQAIVAAVDEVARIDPLGDILVFLPGEREIREATDALHHHALPHTEVIPLYSRLAAAEQDRVFKPHGGRRIVLATNVAETSLTVPGIRFVIDSGLARISRYSHRSQVQRLPIEAISQAAANQRAGRCGRVMAGVAIRLYSEEDFNRRPRYTDPEILRTNLASVILQMATLNLGEVFNFPFLAAPDSRLISDGYRLLHELGAVDERQQLTPLGRQLARIPLDPRLARMLIAADREGALAEVAVIAAALSIQDPRERPQERQQQADQAHARLRDERSDFIALLKLWQIYHQQARHLSQNKLRQWCKANYLSYLRLREWHEVHGQLRLVANELGLRLQGDGLLKPPIEGEQEIAVIEESVRAAIHRALLSGLLGHIAVKDERGNDSQAKQAGKVRRALVEYLGARQKRLAIFPASGVARKPPQWIMAAELVETQRLWARSVAAIDPAWIEPLASHLTRRSYLEPHWEKRRGQVVAWEQVTLYGLIIVGRRPINYGPIDPKASREIFIRQGLIGGEWPGANERQRPPFLRHNLSLLAELEQEEARLRRRDLVVDEGVLYAWYHDHLPDECYDVATLDRWLRRMGRHNPRLLYLQRNDLLREGAAIADSSDMPPQWEIAGLTLPLHYRFEPGQSDDGVTVEIALPQLPQIDPAPFGWQVPGLRLEKITALLRSLPKALRRHFVPAPDFARALLEALPNPPEGDLPVALSRHCQRMSGIAIPHEAWDEASLPPHLRCNFRIVDERGRTLAEGRDLATLQAALRGEVKTLIETAAGDRWQREAIVEWDFGDLPPEVEIRRRGVAVRAWPALELNSVGDIALRLFDAAATAEAAHRRGVAALLRLKLHDKVKYLQRHLAHRQTISLHFAPIGSGEVLMADLLLLAIDSLLTTVPRNSDSFNAALAAIRPQIIATADHLAAALDETLALHHTLRSALRSEVKPAWAAVAADLQDQLARLIYPAMLTEMNAAQLAELPRYLKAAGLRWEKARQQPQRDHELMQQLRPLWLRYWQQPPRYGSELRWMLEELRVSLFAQQLGVKGKVSIQRLERLLEEAERSTGG
jgi:ATP-dependent helicase HrpA